MSNSINANPMSLREGKVFLDGLEIMDQVSCEMTATPDVWTGTTVGNRSESTRWLGMKYKAKITRRRSTPWLLEAVKGYQKFR